MHISCPVNGMYPEMHIWDNQLRIKCCCDVLRVQLRREYDFQMYQAINKDMRKEIKRILR